MLAMANQMNQLFLTKKVALKKTSCVSQINWLRSMKMILRSTSICPNSIPSRNWSQRSQSMSIQQKSLVIIHNALVYLKTKQKRDQKPKLPLQLALIKRAILSTQNKSRWKRLRLKRRMSNLVLLVNKILIAKMRCKRCQNSQK